MSSIAIFSQRSDIRGQQQTGFYYGKRNESQEGNQEAEKSEAEDFSRSDPGESLEVPGGVMACGPS